MKKLIILTLLTFVLTPVTQSFAASTAQPLATGIGAAIGFNASTSVELLYGNQDDATTPQSYVVMAKHNAGNKIIATTSMSNLMQSPTDDDCKGEDIAACLGIGNVAAAISGPLVANTDGEDNVDALVSDGWSAL